MAHHQSIIDLSVSLIYLSISIIFRLLPQKSQTLSRENVKPMSFSLKLDLIRHLEARCRGV